MQFRNVAMIFQKKNESITVYYKRWVTATQVLEAHFGALLPTTISANEASIKDETHVKRFKSLPLPGIA